ncbi:lipase family alpha/beta hydrolase [Patulibacter minatonensis]|uniref:lipase family alpha/beta hydrolase n=1 Tax=Patulibacter minatonensis TaxID=298163 RepID=UPI0006882740|nr:alpha/beta hydrolase [Patulibacter minatonensis]
MSLPALRPARPATPVRPAPALDPGPRRPTASAPRRPTVAVALAVLTGALTAATPAAAATRPFAPVDQPGPPLSPSPAALGESWKCNTTSNVLPGGPTVLFVPATGVTPEQNYDWNWKLALTLKQRHIGYCTVELPQRSLGDVQTAGEYVVNAIRQVHALAGKKISIVGHSQGGMVFRWALRFWPDTREMVDDVIGFAGSNHGTTVIDALPTCSTLGCPVASLQQRAGSKFITALNSGQETFAGISYTNIRTNYDEVVTPSNVTDGATASSSLTTGDGRITNVAVQDVCPGDVSEHLLVGTTSNTAYELAMDALTHDGPAVPSRVPASTCATPLMPGVNPLNLEANLKVLTALPGLVSVVGVNLAGVPTTTTEPALKDYVYAKATAPAPAAAAARPRLRVTPGRIRAGRTTTLRIRVTTTAGKPVAKQRVRILGRTARTSSTGRATLKVRPRKAGLVTARATGGGLPVATKRVRVLPAR